MRIAFLTSADSKDRRSWSGIHYYAARALEKHCGEVFHLGPVKAKRFTPLRLASGLLRRLTGKRYSFIHNPWLAAEYGRIFSEKLEAGKYDLVFASSASVELARVQTSLPTVYFADATFPGMMEYYPAWSNLLGISKRHGCAIERQAFGKSSLLLFPSRWTAESAMQDLGASRAKTFVVPLGANLDEVPSAESVLNKRRSDVCRLLLLGVDWERKGGDVAFEAFLALKKMGVKTTLTVCGCTPPPGIYDPDLHVTGFLNKNLPEHQKRLKELLLNSDFLLLPTRAECFGIVFCEASAYGLPSVTRDTGGVGGAVRDGINGRLLPFEAGPMEYTRVIREVFCDGSAHHALIKSSRQEYENRLNWDAWGRTVSALFQKVLL